MLPHQIFRSIFWLLISKTFGGIKRILTPYVGIYNIGTASVYITWPTTYSPDGSLEHLFNFCSQCSHFQANQPNIPF